MKYSLQINFKNKRNPNIDLLRCILMFGIVYLHTAGQSGKDWWWLSSAFLWCVDGFVFISGYFGIKFKLSKIVRLYGITLFNVLTVAFIRMLIENNSVSQFVFNALKHFCSLWFIHAYVVLMSLSPILNCICDRIIDNKSKVSELFPIFICIFGWGYLTNFGFTKNFIPRTNGLTDFSAVTLGGVYVIAKLCKSFEIYPSKLKMVTTFQ